MKTETYIDGCLTLTTFEENNKWWYKVTVDKELRKKEFWELHMKHLAEYPTI